MNDSTRRQLFRSGRAAVVAGAAGVVAGQAVESAAAPAVAATEGVLDLYVNEGLVRMVDDSLVYMRGFGAVPTDIGSPSPSLRISPHVFLTDGRLVASRSYPLDAPVPEEGRPDPGGPHPTLPGYSTIRREHWASFFPDRTILAESGSTVRLRVHNRLSRPHGLRIAGVAGTGPVAPGTTASLTFAAPPPGTYVYDDPGGGSVERMLGLHGVLVVIDPGARWRLAPGLAEFERQWLWLCQDVDPKWGERARAGEVIDARKTPPVPRYFMLNDQSGYRSLGLDDDEGGNRRRHEDTLPSGSARDVDVRDFSPASGPAGTGQLVRMVNLGAVIHQMHFHGNHVWTVRRNGTDFPRSGGRVDDEGHVVLQQWEDVVELDPLDRKEIVLPIRRPPESTEQVWRARDEDWLYPMHCHAEPSQTAAGGLYPGGLVADWAIAAPGPRRPVQHETYPSQAAFATDQHHEGSPETEFRERPDREFLLKFFGRRLRFPDGAEHDMWSFESETSGRRFPAPVIRFTEEDLVHVTLKPSKRVHTVHLHGVEPDPRNDGVGHTSFEVSGSYTYQFKSDPGTPGDVMQGSAGTYFYHCHVNTVLHVQMGMVGPLIVDPVTHRDFPVPAGARRVFVDGPLYDIATEMLLASYSVDPRWHELSHAAGLSGEDVRLNRFEPKHFYVLGGLLNGPPSRDEVASVSRLRANTRESGHPTLLRMLDFNYFPSSAVFTDTSGRPVRMAEVVSHDGRGFRDTSDPRGPSWPIAVAGSPLLTHRLAFGSAERYDVLLKPPGRGTYVLTINFLDWTAPSRTMARRRILIDAV